MTITQSSTAVPNAVTKTNHHTNNRTNTHIPRKHFASLQYALLHNMPLHHKGHVFVYHTAALGDMATSQWRLSNVSTIHIHTIKCNLCLFLVKNFNNKKESKFTSLVNT